MGQLWEITWNFWAIKIFNNDDLYAHIKQTWHPREKPAGWVNMNDFTTSLILIDSVYLDPGTDYAELFLYT
jgi:hypothetical protein